MSETAGAYHFHQTPTPEVWRMKTTLTHQDCWLLRAAVRYLALAADQGRVEMAPADREQLDRLAELMLKQARRTDKPGHSMYPQRFHALDFMDFDEMVDEWRERFGNLELVQLIDLAGEVRFKEPEAARISITKDK